MSIFIVGTGIGDTKYLTASAREKIENADIIIGSERAAKKYEGTLKKVYFEYGAEKIAKILGNTKYKNAAVLFTGDASFYSGAKGLAKLFPDAEIEPGISSMAYFCAKTGESYDDMNIVSLHGRKCNIVSEVRRNHKTFALLGENPCAKLCKFGLGGARVTVGESLSYPDEKIYGGSAAELAGREFSPLTVMVIKNNSPAPAARFGIDDGEFITGNSPMTKQAVRAVTMAKLQISPEDICVDVGAGTGSVSVEMALAAYRGTVYSVEKRADRAELVRKNAVKFMADNIEIREGTAPDALDGLPRIDKAFIGGGGDIKKILEKLYCPHVVVNAITLETLTGTLKALEELGYSCDTAQISASNAVKKAGFNMMTAQNPVFVITGRREAGR